MASRLRIPKTQHHYVSTACLHGLHDRCRDTCKFCGAPCACDGPLCEHGASRDTAQYELQQAIAVAIFNSPSIHEGETSPWLVAGDVIKALRKINPIKTEEAS